MDRMSDRHIGPLIGGRRFTRAQYLYVGFAVLCLTGMFLALLLPGFGGVDSNSHSSSSFDEDSGSTENPAPSNLRNLATAEESYLTDHDIYTDYGPELEPEGFRRSSPDIQLYLAADGASGYCLVGSADGSAPWFLYDSAHQGLQPAFDSVAEAQAGCIDPAMPPYTLYP